MDNTIEIIRDVFDIYGQQNPDKINKVYSYCTKDSILNLVSWLGELKDFNYKDCEEFIKQKYITDFQNKIVDRENLHKEEINKINEVNQARISEIKGGLQNQINIYIEQRDKEIQEKKDLMSFINNMKNNTNSSIGRDGEERVHNALLKNSKYSTMEIDDVSSTLGGGDLNIYLREHDISLLVEVKNWKRSIDKVNMQRFIENSTDFFKQKHNSHSVIFSIGSTGFYGKGSFNVEEFTIDNNTHLIMYCSEDNMTSEKINHHFNYFIDRIIDYRNRQLDEDEGTLDLKYKLCNGIKINIEGFNTHKEYLQKTRNDLLEQTEKIDIQLKDIDLNIKNNMLILNECNYSYTECDTSYKKQISDRFKSDNIPFDTLENFKVSFKSNYKSIPTFSETVINNSTIKHFRYKALYDIYRSI
tara:strand:+ start:1333 stop:2577 length:1245 start_codon:yes stop_codon:yes gene_type:complete